MRLGRGCRWEIIDQAVASSHEPIDSDAYKGRASEGKCAHAGGSLLYPNIEDGSVVTTKVRALNLVPNISFNLPRANGYDEPRTVWNCQRLPNRQRFKGWSAKDPAGLLGSSSIVSTVLNLDKQALKSGNGSR
jgi:hypothetical protein